MSEQYSINHSQKFPRILSREYYYIIGNNRSMIHQALTLFVILPFPDMAYRCKNTSFKITCANQHIRFVSYISKAIPGAILQCFTINCLHLKSIYKIADCCCCVYQRLCIALIFHCVDAHIIYVSAKQKSGRRREKMLVQTQPDSQSTPVTKNNHFMASECVKLL